MNSVLRIALVMLCFSVPARAAEDASADDVGVGVVCDTAKQVERLVGAINGGKELEDAVQVVNIAEGNAAACTLAAVAFTTSVPVSQQTLQGESVAIVQIKVYAVSNGDSWKRVPDTVQYTVMQPKGETI
jgi:hypothetical protein